MWIDRREPLRLCLRDTHCQVAKDAGVLVSIRSDAHSDLDFDNLSFGVGQVRRGWLEKKDVLDTRALQEIRPLLKQTQ
jgi:DNA polymerase (family 10)